MYTVIQSDQRKPQTQQVTSDKQPETTSDNNYNARLLSRWTAMFFEVMSPLVTETDTGSADQRYQRNNISCIRSLFCLIFM